MSILVIAAVVSTQKQIIDDSMKCKEAIQTSNCHYATKNEVVALCTKLHECSLRSQSWYLMIPELAKRISFSTINSLNSIVIATKYELVALIILLGVIMWLCLYYSSQGCILQIKAK